MDAGRAQRGITTGPEASERVHQQGYLCGLTRAAAGRVGSLTRARVTTADPTNPEGPAARATLQVLNARGNRLASLPETLPAELRQFDAGCNRMIALPAPLPCELSGLATPTVRPFQSNHLIRALEPVPIVRH